MTGPDEKLLAPLLDIARSASQQIMRIYATDFDVATKADQSPVTEADLAAHQVIVTDLKRITPDIPVLSEESADIPYAERRRWDSYWLVDPLDGTKEFISKNGDFTVNIALVQNGEPLVGVVHVPATGLSYYGCVGVGAFRRDQDGQASPIHVRKLIPDAPVKVVASRSHRGELLDGYLEKLGAHTTVSRGSSLKFCLVAEGAADVYPRLGPTSEWDTAAGHAVLTAAGGQVIGVDGAPLRYNTKDSLLNPHFIACADAARDWRSYL
ncbi:MAG TPA: 3'(2'),5'-bisphosphate nucleotidase CysQ [Gammaproteobacteria bacterium]|nr:3'(2'),5'-bisphosphate nucleotidase CysQ [Gammaproteobacteria bacterium]